MIAFNGFEYIYENSKSWNTLQVLDANKKQIYEKKFQKSNLSELMKDAEFATYFDDMLEIAFVIKSTDYESITTDDDSAEAIKKLDALCS
jgi:hypothetical protein